MFIRSARLFLRPGWPEDQEELRSRIDDSTAVSKSLLIAASAGLQDRRLPRFLVTLPSGDGSRLIGCAGLIASEHGPELVCWIAPEYTGQGFATEAGRAVLSLAHTLGHHRISAFSHVDNPASTRVLDKLGFAGSGETCQRLCPVRGMLDIALVHRRNRGAPSDCDGRTPALDRGATRHAA